MEAGKLGWTQSDFDFSEPRYLFNAIRGRFRADYETARLIGLYASKIHAAKPIGLKDYGLFPWEKASDYAPKFSEVNKEAFDRISAFQFPTDN